MYWVYYLIICTLSEVKKKIDLIIKFSFSRLHEKKYAFHFFYQYITEAYNVREQIFSIKHYCNFISWIFKTEINAIIFCRIIIIVIIGRDPRP